MAERPDFYDLIAQNRRRTWVLMFSFFVLLALVGIAVSIVFSTTTSHTLE